jgi:TetR/AcrR family transcriptional regulator, cholesterol catabolism regulator
VTGVASTKRPANAAAAPAAVLGRRERKKRDTHRRIFEAAEDLFTRKGYAAVTTQEIADLADVGTGTLFRYASTKAELLIMVMSERLRLGAAHGLAIAERGGSVPEAIVGLIEPLVRAALTHPENTSAFQREVLFGADGPYRAQALGRIRELEGAMVSVLERYAELHPTRPGADPRRVAETVFSVLYLKLVRLELGRADPDTLPRDLLADVDYLVRELLDPAPDPR